MGFLCRGAVGHGRSWPSARWFLTPHEAPVQGSRDAWRLPSPLANFSVGFPKPSPAEGRWCPLAAVPPSALPAARPAQRRLQGAGSCGQQPLGPALDLGVQVCFRLTSFPHLSTQLRPFGSRVLVAAVMAAGFSPHQQGCPRLVLVLQRCWHSWIQLFASFYSVINFGHFDIWASCSSS